MTGMRVPHVIRSLKRMTYPTRIIAFAVEPWVRYVRPGIHEHTFRVAAGSTTKLHAGQVVNRAYCDLGHAQDVLDYLFEGLCHDRTTWIVAHGLGYALTLCDYWTHVGRGSLELLWGVYEDPPTILAGRAHGRRYRMVDIANYWRQPLSQIAVSVGVTLPERSGGDETTTECLERCRLRVRATEELICMMVKELSSHQLSGLRSTAASTAWSAWRSSYNQCPVSVHCHPAALGMERSALFGGQLMMRRLGHVSQPIVSVDCNSLYPYVSALHPQPVRLGMCYRYPSMLDLRQRIRDWWCLSHVTATPDWPLPWRPGPDLLEYHVDTRDYWVCGPTLARLVDEGRVGAVHALSCYTVGDPFSGFVRDIYRRRLDSHHCGNETAAALYKMLLNSLFGRFAQRTSRWVDQAGLLCPRPYGEWTRVNARDGEITRCRAIAGMGQVYEEGVEARESCPVITASICELGRLHLRQLVEDAGKDQVVYAYTDCAHVTEQGFANLVALGHHDEERLGGVKVAHQGVDAVYWGPMHYRIGDHYCSNLLSPSAREVSEGMYLQESRTGLPLTLSGKHLDRVVVRDRVVHAPAGHTRTSTLAGASESTNEEMEAA